MTQTEDLKGQIALVTGASRGIGRAIAHKLSQAGARVYINFVSNEKAAEESRSECSAKGTEAVLCQGDVSKSEQVDRIFEKIKSEQGRLDILVNNAGIHRDGLAVRLRDSDWEETLGVNLSAAFYCSRAAAKMMMRARFGRIVNMSSVVGQMGNVGQSPYVASKAGVDGLTKAMARELGSRGITVNAVSPGYIETEMTDTMESDLREGAFRHIPLGRFGSVEDVADLVHFLAGPNSGYITGQVIGVNGGLFM